MQYEEYITKLFDLEATPKSEPAYKHYDTPCIYLRFDSDGDYCALRKGFGVNSHCYAYNNRQCLYYTER